MTLPTNRYWGLAGAALALMAAIAAQTGRDAWYPRSPPARQRLLYVRSGAAMKRLTLEFNAIAADFYWVSTIQHYGGDRKAADGRRKYELLQPLLDLTTTLDPYFSIAYRFGSLFLAEAPPGGPGRPDQAIALLEKGIAAQPGKWQYFHDLGFVYYWHLHDPVAAARWFERGAAQPGAPLWLHPLAAGVLAAHDRGSARAMWQRMLESDQPWLGRLATRSLAQLQALDDLEALQAAVSPSVAAGRRLTWADQVRRGLLRSIPLDPTGIAYALDPVTGRVSLDPESSLNPLPELGPAPK